VEQRYPLPPCHHCQKQRPRAPKGETIQSYSSPQDTTNKVDYQVSGDTLKQKVQSIVVNSVRAENELKSAGQDALYAGQKITLKDRLLLDKFVDAKRL